MHFPRIIPTAILAIGLSGCVSERERQLDENVTRLQNDVQTLTTRLQEQSRQYDELNAIVASRINTPEVLAAIAALEGKILTSVNTRLEGRETALETQLRALERKGREADIQMTNMEGARRTLENTFDPQEYNTLKGTIAGIQSGTLTFREDDYYPFKRDQLRQETWTYMFEKNTQLYGLARLTALTDLTREESQALTDFTTTYFQESATFDRGTSEQNERVCTDLRTRLTTHLHELRDQKATHLNSLATRAREILRTYNERLQATSTTELGTLREQYDTEIGAIYSPPPVEEPR